MINKLKKWELCPKCKGSTLPSNHRNITSYDDYNKCRSCGYTWCGACFGEILWNKSVIHKSKLAPNQGQCVRNEAHKIFWKD